MTFEPRDNKTSDANWYQPPPYSDSTSAPSAPSIDTFPPYGTVKNTPPPLLVEEPSRGKSKICTYTILGLFALLLLFSNTTSSFSFPGWRKLYDWEALPKEFEFQPTRLVFQTIGGSLNEGHIHIKQGSGRAELSARISSDLIDHPDLTYRLVRDNTSTLFEIHIPPQYHYRRYIRLDATLYVPDMDVLDVRLQNSEYYLDPNAKFDIKSLLLSTSNTPIQFGTDWEGNELVLKTSNGKISVTRAVLGADTVTLQTSNAHIQTTQTVQTEKQARLATSNGAIDAEGVLETPDLELKTSNAAVHVYQVNADTAVIATSNGRLELKHANVTSSLEVKTSNADLHVNVDTCQYCDVKAQTSNSRITANLPVDHEGPFSIDTSSSRSIRFEDSLDWSKIQVHGKSSLRGERYNPEEAATKGGRVVVQTTNADAIVSFKKN